MYVFPCESLEKWVTWAEMNWRDFLIVVFALNHEEHFSTGCRSFGIFLHILLVCPFSDLPSPLLLYKILRFYWKVGCRLGHILQDLVYKTR